MVYKEIPYSPTSLVNKILMINPKTLVRKPPIKRIKIDVLNVSFFNIHLSYSATLLYNNICEKKFFTNGG